MDQAASNAPKTAAKRKRKLEEIMAELPSLEVVKSQYTPLQTVPRQPKLHIPNTADADSPYALFSLFLTEEIFDKIADSTNAYARAKLPKIHDANTHARSWKDTNAAEIKVFFGILIYMGVHESPREDLYWRNDPEKGPLHLPRLYMTHKRFEQIKRFLHISHPDEQPNKYLWWYKLAPLASHILRASREYYTPGANVSTRS
ncbi:hypothetical protein VTO42DRAFT_6853 [Malbranchea cinnamomea]